jgi:hypothetical protein
MIKSFTLKQIPSHVDLEPGVTVYESAKYDYGLASDDSRFTGIHHVSVTLDPTGDYPFFTVPAHFLEPIENVTT